MQNKNNNPDQTQRNQPKGAQQPGAANQQQKQSPGSQNRFDQDQQQRKDINMSGNRSNSSAYRTEEENDESYVGRRDSSAEYSKKAPERT